MNLIPGVIFFPLAFAARRPLTGKVDRSLLNKVRTSSIGRLSAIVFSNIKETHVCKKCLESLGASIKYDLPFIQAYAVEFPTAKLQEMTKQSSVKYIADDVKMSCLLDTATREVGARFVNETGYSGKNVGIAIIDTGIYPHADLTRPRNRIIAFKDFVNKRTNPYDDNGHGTFVAGVAAGNGQMSGGKYAGVAPEANLIGIKVMDVNGEGKSSDILAGMQWVADHHKEYNIRVVSLSLGTQASGGFGSDPLVMAVEQIWKRGILVVVAAGNSGPDRGTITSPGVSKAVVTVGAVDDKRTVDISDDVVADFSSRGPARGGIQKPDIVAPGVNVVSLSSDVKYVYGSRFSVLSDYYTTMSGTSVATPIVSGIGALMFGKYPQWTPSQVKESILKHAKDINDSIFAQGRGIVDVKSMMEDKKT